MAKSMMLENVAVLELNVNEGKDKEGKLNGKKYHSLVCFEFGEKYPKITKLNIQDSLLSAASVLIGKRCSILATVFEFNDKMSLAFAEGSPVQK